MGSPLESAEMQVGLAYTAASLYFSYLLTQGTELSDHPIQQELDRIKVHFKKVSQTAEDIEAEKAKKDRMRVDSAAAKRIVQHYSLAAEAATQRHLAAIKKPGVAELASPGVVNARPKKKKRRAVASEKSCPDTVVVDLVEEGDLEPVHVSEAPEVTLLQATPKSCPSRYEGPTASIRPEVGALRKRKRKEHQARA